MEKRKDIEKSKLVDHGKLLLEARGENAAILFLADNGISTDIIHRVVIEHRSRETV